MVGVSKDALDLFFGINGFNDKSAANILWYFTGYDDFDVYMEEIKYVNPYGNYLEGKRALLFYFTFSKIFCIIKI